MFIHKLVAFTILALVVNVSTRPVDLGQDATALSSVFSTSIESAASTSPTVTVATRAISTPSVSSLFTQAALATASPQMLDVSVETSSLPTPALPPTSTLVQVSYTTLASASALPSPAAPSHIPFEEQRAKVSGGQRRLEKCREVPLPTMPGRSVFVCTPSAMPDGTATDLLQSATSSAAGVVPTPAVAAAIIDVVETSAPLPSETAGVPTSAPSASMSAPTMGTFLVPEPSLAPSLSMLTPSTPTLVPSVPYAATSEPPAMPSSPLVVPTPSVPAPVSTASA